MQNVKCISKIARIYDLSCVICAKRHFHKLSFFFFFFFFFNLFTSCDTDDYLSFPVHKLTNVGMAVPKTTETRCKDGSVQARRVIQRLRK